MLLEKAKQLATKGEKVNFLIATQDKFTDLKPEMIEQAAKNRAVELKQKFKEEYANQSTDNIAQRLIKTNMELDRARSKTKIEDSSDHFLYMDIKNRLSRGFPNINVQLVYMSEVGQLVRELMLRGEHVLLDEFGTFQPWDYDPKWFTEEHVVKVNLRADFVLFFYHLFSQVCKSCDSQL